MKNVIALSSVLAFGLLALPAAAQTGKSSAVLTPAADLKWNDVPGFQGLKMAVAEGDPSKGASHFFIKFEPGFKAPVHHHTANHFVNVVSGTLVLVVDGKETRLPPGSYFSFTKKQKHGTACEAGAECVLSIDARGKWDVIPEKEKAGEEKK
jgi:quercetin dioxygenase-like cupin family protein